jgi:type IV secretory pathway VirB2 component (pilin)
VSKYFLTILLVTTLLVLLGLVSKTALAADFSDVAQIKDLEIVLQRIITFMFGIAGAVAIIMIIIGGFRYMIASGDPKMTESAKHTVSFAVAGLIIVLLAFFVVNLVGNLLGAPGLTVIKFGQSNSQDQFPCKPGKPC